VIGRKLIPSGNALAVPPPSYMGCLYAAPPWSPGGEERRFGLAEVQRWGRLTYYGDAIAHIVAEVGGSPYKLMGGERTPEEASFLRKFGKRFPGQRPGRGEWCLIWEPEGGSGSADGPSGAGDGGAR
jgi:hypothetical protein